VSVRVLEGFERPFGVRAEAGGSVLVCDLKAGRIARSGGAGGEWKADGGPHSVAVAADGTAYATLFYGRRIVRLGGDGRLETVAAADPARPWLLAGPAGIELDPAGRLVVGDYGSDSLQRFSPDGEFLGWLGAGASGWTEAGAPSKSAEPGGFDRVHAALFMPDGTMLAADTWNHRLQRFDASGRFLEALGRKGAAPGEFDAPVALAALDGGFVCSEYGGSRVRSFDASGRPRAWKGAALDGLNHPYDVKSDGTRLLVADTDNRRVLIVETQGG
jgi:sugar lactone lactonase YvrE